MGMLFFARVTSGTALSPDTLASLALLPNMACYDDVISEQGRGRQGALCGRSFLLSFLHLSFFVHPWLGVSAWPSPPPGLQRSRR